MTKCSSIVLRADRLAPELAAAMKAGAMTCEQMDALTALAQDQIQQRLQLAEKTGEFALVLAVSELPYENVPEDVCEWQEDRDYESEFKPEDMGNNRFDLGYTAFFCGADKHSDHHEVCKAILPDIYDWLTEHAPNAKIEMGHWDILDPADLDLDDDEDDLSGDATVWINFGQDYAAAVAFKLRFG